MPTSHLRHSTAEFTSDPLLPLRTILFDPPSTSPLVYTSETSALLLKTLYSSLWGNEIDCFLHTTASRPRAADFIETDEPRPFHRRSKHHSFGPLISSASTTSSATSLSNSALSPFPGHQPWSLSHAQMLEDVAWEQAILERKGTEWAAIADRSRRKRRKGAICGRSLKRGERCYNCKTCGVDSSCVMCADCYFASDHAGHDVSYGVAFSFSGYCDCGDPDAWLQSCSCALHPPPDQPNDPSSTNPLNPPPGLLSKLSVEQQHQIVKTVHLVIDFIIDTLRNSPLETSAVPLPKNLESLLERGEESAHTYRKWKAAQDSRKIFSLVLWADEKHTVKEIVRQLAQSTRWPDAKCKHLIGVLEKEGRVVLETSDSHYLLLHIAHAMARIDVGITLRPAYDTYREQACGTLIVWLADLVESVVENDDLFLRRVIASAMFSRYQRGHGDTNPEDQDIDIESAEVWEEYEEIGDMQRADWLFCLFSRLWRKPRTDMMKVLVKILTTDVKCKLAIGDHFAKVYHRLVDQYIFSDREPELNLLLWGMQLFPISSLAESAVRNQNLSRRLIQILISYFTEQHDNHRIYLPPRMRMPARADAEAQSFRTKKWQTISSHLRAVLHSKGVRRLMIEIPALFDELVAFLSLFVGMAPQLRATGDHVEYESDSWIRALGVSMDLSRMTWIVGQGWATARADELLYALEVVTRRIRDIAWLKESSLDPTKFAPPEFLQVQALGLSHVVIHFEVRYNWISIHNPVHYLYGELLKHASHLVDTSRVKWSAERDDDSATLGVQVIAEYPLRTITYLAQVKAGLWVRNGIGMRGQLHHYREHPLRETTYDQDLLVVQYAFTAINPHIMLLSIIDHFDLVNFFQGVAWRTQADMHFQSHMVEEFLLLLIHLFSETAAIVGWSKEDITRREMIQQLCLGPLSYNDLLKRLSERTVDVPTFSDILDTVATLRQPQAVSETGVYELRPECFDEVNPLFYHYSRNQQGDAYEILVSRLKKAEPSLPSDQAMIFPKGVTLPPSPMAFSNLLAIFDSPYVIYVCFYAIHNVLVYTRETWPAAQVDQIKPQMDGIIDLALHLCLLAFVQSPEASANAACQNPKPSSRQSLMRYLCDMERDGDYKMYKPRVTAILNLISKHRQTQVDVCRVPRNSATQPAMSAEEVRKVAVRKRQDDILAGFAKNQQQFMDNYYDDDEDEDEGMTDSMITHGPCIVCQEECSPARPSGLLACIQPSMIMRDACNDRAWFKDILEIPTTLDRDTRKIRYGFGTTGEPVETDAYPRDSHRFGLHVSACGHLMHEDCLAKFFRDTELRQSLQGQRNHPENAYRREFVCPLCKSVGNVLVPLDAPPRPAPLATASSGYMPLNDWIRRVSDESLRDVRDPGRMWDQHLATGEVMPWFAISVDHLTGLGSGAKGILSRFASVVGPVSQQTTFLHGRADSGMYLPEALVAYTIGMVEITNRGQGHAKDATSKSGLSDTTHRLLRGLIAILGAYMDLSPGPLKDAPCRRVSIFARFLPDWFRNNRLTSPLLLRDPLTIVVETAALCPDILQPVMVLAYHAELTRTMLAMSFWAKKCLPDVAKGVKPLDIPSMDETSADAHSIFQNFRSIALSMFRNSPQLHHEAASILSVLSDAQISRLLYAFTLPFLRRCAIIKHVVGSSIGFPVVQHKPIDSKVSEYTRLLGTLGIPAPRTTLSDSTSSTSIMISTWLQPWSTSQPVLPPLEFPGIYELYRLPRSLEDILKNVLGRRCRKCDREPVGPAICYLCGEFLCLGTDCCAEGEMGELNLHRMRCGGATGIFIDIKRWALVYLYGGSGSYGPMPFLDSHGELDQAMRRGHPQFQYQPRADELRRVWLNHGVPSFVARRLELTLDQGGWQSL